MDMQMGVPMSMSNNNGGFPAMNMNMNGGGMGAMMDASHDLPSWALETYYGVGEQQSSSSSSSSMAENGDGGEATATSNRQQAHVQDDAFRFPADFLPAPSASSSSSTDAPSPAHSDNSHGSGSSAGSSSVGNNMQAHMPMNGFEMGGMMDLDSLPLHFAPPSISPASSSPVPAPASAHTQPHSNDVDASSGMITFHNPFFGDNEHALALDVPISVDDPLLGMGLQFSLGYDDYDLLNPSQQF